MFLEYALCNHGHAVLVCDGVEHGRPSFPPGRDSRCTRTLRGHHARSHSRRFRAARPPWAFDRVFRGPNPRGHRKPRNVLAQSSSDLASQALHGWLRASTVGDSPWWNGLLRLRDSLPPRDPARERIEAALADVQYVLVEREVLQRAHEAAHAYSTDLALRNAIVLLGWHSSIFAARVDVLLSHSEMAWLNAAQALAAFRFGRSVSRTSRPEAMWRSEGFAWDAAAWGYDPDALFTKLAAASCRR